jgi:hypothetical protein
MINRMSIVVCTIVLLRHSFVCRLHGKFARIRLVEVEVALSYALNCLAMVLSNLTRANTPRRASGILAATTIG